MLERWDDVNERRLDLVLRPARRQQRPCAKGPPQEVVVLDERLEPCVLSDRMQEIDAEVADQLPRRFRVICDGDDRVEAATPKQGVQPRRSDDVVDAPRAYQETHA